MAPIWKAMVCRLHNINRGELDQGRNTYGSHIKRFSRKAQRPIGFVAFDTYKSLLQDADGRVSGPGTVIAGFGAGATESVLAVTPFESIKTQL